MSPRNYRANVGDVVVIFTMGGGDKAQCSGENTKERSISSEEYKRKAGDECLIAKERSEKLKERNINVVIVAWETENISKIVNDELKEWSTAGKYFQASKENLKTIIDNLTSATCIAPGKIKIYYHHVKDISYVCVQ